MAPFLFYMKICKLCKVEKPFSQYSKCVGMKDGLRSNCKKCRSDEYFKNKNYYSILAKNWKNNNYIKNKQYQKHYDKENRKRKNAIEAKRRAIKLKATPKWLNYSQLQKIEKMYKNCKHGYHVDHIIPLKGKNVCGLHVPWNLQYLPALENISKGNRVS